MTRHPQAPAIPHDVTAEESVLGGILLRNEALALLPRLEVQDFYSPKHQAVFVAMRNLEAAAAPIDHVTLEGELERMGRWQATGLDVIGNLLKHCPTVENTQHYASILASHRLSREVMRACLDIAEAVRGGTLEGDEAVQAAVTKLMAVKTRKADPGRTVTELIRAELSSIARDVMNNAPESGVSTGVEVLDRNTGGYPVGSVSVVLGATGHGKSTLLGNGARAGAAAGDLALVYSFEDPHKFWAQRAIAQESGVPTEVIARRYGLHDDKARVERVFAARQAKRGEVIIPSSQWSADEVIRDVQYRRARDLALTNKRRRCSVWVDYVQVIRLEMHRNGNREQGIAHAMDRLSWLAQGCGTGEPEDECAVILGSQVKQVVIDEKRPPRLNDGADSFSIAKVCKFMLGINRPSKYDPSADSTRGRIDVLKRNQGDDDVTADVVLDLATHSIRAVPPREVPTWQR